MWILFFVLFAPFSPAIDLYVSGLFFEAEKGFYDNIFFHTLFKYGELFGLLTGGAAAFIFLLSFFLHKLKKWRKGTLVMLLTLIIGAGLITNLCLKEYWGRPRPKQVIEFGGKHAYRPFWRPDFNTRHDPQKSFPSGHVAMGFYFLSLCLVGKRYQLRLLFTTGLVLTLFLGGGLFIARVVQGGHFVSDALASAMIMWYVSRGADKFVFTLAGWARRDLCSKLTVTSQELDDH